MFRFEAEIDFRGRNGCLLAIHKFWINGNHPNLVRIFAHGVLSTQDYAIDMEFCSYNLENHLENTLEGYRVNPGDPVLGNFPSCGLNTVEICTIMSQITDAIKFLHDQKIVYGRLHPRNGTSKRKKLILSNKFSMQAGRSTFGKLLNIHATEMTQITPQQGESERLDGMHLPNNHQSPIRIQNHGLTKQISGPWGVSCASCVAEGEHSRTLTHLKLITNSPKITPKISRSLFRKMPEDAKLEI